MKRTFDEIRYIALVRIADEDGAAEVSNLTERPLYCFFNSETSDAFGFCSPQLTFEGSISDIICGYVETSFSEEFRRKIDQNASFDFLRELVVGADTRDAADFEYETERETALCDADDREKLAGHIGCYGIWSIIHSGASVAYQDGTLSVESEDIGEPDEIFATIETSSDSTILIVK